MRFYALGLEIILLTVNWGYRCQRLNFSVVSLYFFFFLFFSSAIFEFSQELFIKYIVRLVLLFLFTAPVIIWEYCWCDNKCGDGTFSIILWLGLSLLWLAALLWSSPCPSVTQESWRGRQWVFLFPHVEHWSWFNLGISLSLGWLDSCKVQGG